VLFGEFQALFCEPAAGQAYAVLRGVGVEMNGLIPERPAAGEERPGAAAVPAGVNAEEGTDAALQQPVQSGNRVHALTVLRAAGLVSVRSPGRPTGTP
jgi:hypothetical protein